MKESLIFSNINSFALVRQLAQRGIDSLGIRVFNNRELLSYIWQKNTLFPKEKIISNKEKAYIYNRLIRESTYFKGSSFEDGKSLCETIDSIRELIEEDEDKVLKDKLLNSSSSKEKYEEIYNIYSKYIKYLNDNNLTDVIVEERKIISSNISVENEITYIKEEDITPLSLKLLNRCFKSIKEINYRDLYGVKETPIILNNLYKTKGFVHEIGNVFKIINESKLPFDKCSIVCTNVNNFYNSIKEISKTFNIPVTFIDGIPAHEYNAYRLLYLIVKHNDNLYGYDTLKELLYDRSFNFEKMFSEIVIKDYFDDYIKLIGDLKLSFNQKENDIIFNNYSKHNTKFGKEVEQFKNILNKGLINFINEYTIEDDDVIKNNLLKDIELYESINGSDDFDFLRTLYNQNITSSYCKEGSITVCSLGKARENIRDNMFFVGNDSETFHITLAENTFISDEKLLEISPNYAKTSLKLAEIKKDLYKNTIQICMDLGVNTHISYTELDEIELKKHNFISILYILNQQGEPKLTFDKFKEKFNETNAYAGNKLTKDEEIITNYLNEKVNIIPNEDKKREKKKLNDLLDKTYYPTEIEVGLGCRRRFLISKLLKVADKEKYDVFNKFEHYDKGNMFHDVMQYINKNKNITEGEAVKYGEETFDKLCSARNPILINELLNDKKDFIRLVKYGYHYLHTKKQGESEEPITKDIKINSNTIHLGGRPDLVTDTEIIDYKAKSSISHKEEDKLSCIQALLYAYLRDDKNIDHVEYYYPVYKKAIKTTYNKKYVESILNTFITNLIENNFDPAYLNVVEKKKGKAKEKDETEEDKDINKIDKDKLDEICKYCEYNDVCGKEQWKKEKKQKTKKNETK